MIKEYPNGDSIEIKGLTVTVKLGDESMRKIRKAALDEIDTLRDENARLRELVRDMWFWGYEGHMDSESQEWQMKHIDGVLDRMRELGIEWMEAGW